MHEQRLRVPREQFESFVERHRIDVETLVPRGPTANAMETVVSLAFSEEVNAMSVFSHVE